MVKIFTSVSYSTPFPKNTTQNCMTFLSDILQTTLTNTEKLSIHFVLYHIIFHCFINQQEKIHMTYIYIYAFKNKVFPFLSVACSKPQELNKYMIILNNTDSLKIKTIIYKRDLKIYFWPKKPVPSIAKEGNESAYSA